MKKLLLTLLATIFIVISAFSQTYIGHSKEYIMKDIGSEYIKNFTYADSGVLSLTFTDNHTAVYVFDDELCIYYILIYNKTYLQRAVEIANGAAYKYGDFRWYLTQDGNYVYIKINSASKSDAIFMNFFLLEYENDVDNILSAF